MATKRSPARLVIALSIAAALAVFLLYTSIAGGGTPSLRPSQLAAQTGEISVAGRVVGKPAGDPHGSGLRFTLRDVKGTATVPVVYTGSVPDFSARIATWSSTEGWRRAFFIATPGSLVTKCPSKYTAAKPASG